MSRMRTPFLTSLMAIFALMLSALPIVTSTSAAQTGTGSVRITLKTCGDNAKPWIDLTGCTEVIEDDGVEYLYPYGNATDKHYLKDDARGADGSYMITGLSPKNQYMLEGFDPVKKKFVYATGVLLGSRGGYVQPEAGKTLDVTLYYYNGTAAPTWADDQTHYVDGPSTGQWDVIVTLKGCPAGVQPSTAPERCTEKIEDDGMEYIQNEKTGEKHYLKDDARDGSGAYHLGALPGGTYTYHGFEPIKYNSYLVEGDAGYHNQIVVEEGTTTNIVFYYYNK